MMNQAAPIRQIDDQLIEGLYLEAIVLADEARAYFAHSGERNRASLSDNGRLDYACESLKVSTRIMHAIAWLLVQRAVLSGELPESVRLDEHYQLGKAEGTDARLRATLPAEMEGLILVSEDLYYRVARLEAQLIERLNLGLAARSSPARDLLGRLQSAF